MPNDDHKRFDEAFAGVVAVGDSDVRASLLVHLCKAFDLREPHCRQVVAAIAQWIRSPNGNVRREVVFALCLLRPVPGFECLAVAGWKAADAGDLHWYAAAIERVFRARDMLSPSVVWPVADLLFRTPPQKRIDMDDFAYSEALADHKMCLGEAMRVMRHFHGVLFGAGAAGEVLPDPSGTIDWRCMAQVLYQVGRNERVEQR